MWKYFSYENDKMLACPCCGAQGMAQGFMNDLDALRESCGFPFIVTSGYRCPEYNNKISGTGLTGPHTTGRAVDVNIYGALVAPLIKKAYDRGFNGLGVQQKGVYKKRFVHLDKARDSRAFWSY